MNDHPCFERGDFDDALPAPGFYPSTIRTARYRLSRGGHRMLLVVHALDGVVPPNDQIADYFTLEGVSARGLATARRRLLRLYQACGLSPVPSESIEPADLYNGERRLKVVGYRHADQPPF